MDNLGLLLAFLTAAVSLSTVGCGKSGQPNAPHTARPASVPQDKGLGAPAGLLFYEIPTNPSRTSVAVDVLGRTSGGEWAPPKRIFDFDDPDAVHGVYPSPDGRWVAITLNDKPQMAGPLDRDSDDIVLYSFAKNKLYRLTDDNYGYSGFLWSADSRYFACSAQENPYSPLATERALRFVWVHDTVQGILFLVARHATAYGWGPEPGRLLFQTSGSKALYQFDVQRKRRTVVGSMPVAFANIMGRWAYVSRENGTDHRFYQLEVNRKGGRASIRAILAATLTAKAWLPFNALSPDGQMVAMTTTQGGPPLVLDRLLVLDLSHRTLRYFQPPDPHVGWMGWSKDSRGVLVVAGGEPEGPNKHDNNQVWSVLIDSVPETPVEKVDWRHAHHAQAVLIKETDPMIEPQAWLGPAR